MLIWPGTAVQRQTDRQTVSSLSASQRVASLIWPGAAVQRDRLVQVHLSAKGWLEVNLAIERLHGYKVPVSK